MHIRVNIHVTATIIRATKPQAHPPTTPAHPHHHPAHSQQARVPATASDLASQSSALSPHRTKGAEAESEEPSSSSSSSISSTRAAIRRAEPGHGQAQPRARRRTSTLFLPAPGLVHGPGVVVEPARASLRASPDCCLLSTTRRVRVRVRVWRWRCRRRRRTRGASLGRASRCA